MACIHAKPARLSVPLKLAKRLLSRSVWSTHKAEIEIARRNRSTNQHTRVSHDEHHATAAEPNANHLAYPFAVCGDRAERIGTSTPRPETWCGRTGLVAQRLAYIPEGRAGEKSVATELPCLPNAVIGAPAACTALLLAEVADGGGWTCAMRRGQAAGVGIVAHSRWAGWPCISLAANSPKKMLVHWSWLVSHGWLGSSVGSCERSEA